MLFPALRSVLEPKHCEWVTRIKAPLQLSLVPFHGSILPAGCWGKHIKLKAFEKCAIMCSRYSQKTKPQGRNGLSPNRPHRNGSIFQLYRARRKFLDLLLPHSHHILSPFVQPRNAVEGAYEYDGNKDFVWNVTSNFFCLNLTYHPCTCATFRHSALRRRPNTIF